MSANDYSGHTPRKITKFRTMKELDLSPSEWHDPQGNIIPLCVVEELQEGSTLSVPAIVTLGGFSLCRDHMELMVEELKAGETTSAIFGRIVSGDL